jgi:hypothetical protein
VYQADYAGWADLDVGVDGRVKSTYYFSGQQEQVSNFFPSCPFFFVVTLFLSHQPGENASAMC